LSLNFLVQKNYRRSMEWLYLACIVLSGTALVAITLMIPAGVFMRYVMNNPLSWPEPASVVMMVAFSFLGGAAVYRAHVHVAVEALVNSVGPNAQRVLRRTADACMAATTLFMLGYGTQLCAAMWHQSIAEFPGLPVGLTYLPIPLAGLFTLLFIIERLWLGSPPRSSVMYSDQPTDLE
jgi:TRAP-type C4-dicarboxylate transport system permease small subunit